MYLVCSDQHQGLLHFFKICNSFKNLPGFINHGARKEAGGWHHYLHVKKEEKLSP